MVIKNLQKGFVTPLVIVIITLLVIIGGVYIFKNKHVEIEKSDDRTISLSRYDNKIVNQCISNYQSENSRISSGYIVIGFSTTTSLVSAKEIIKSHNLTPKERPGEYYSSLYANVTAGEEFLWSCRLKQDSRIRYADPSPVYDIDV